MRLREPDRWILGVEGRVGAGRNMPGHGLPTWLLLQGESSWNCPVRDAGRGAEQDLRPSCGLLGWLAAVSLAHPLNKIRGSSQPAEGPMSTVLLLLPSQAFAWGS